MKRLYAVLGLIVVGILVFIGYEMIMAASSDDATYINLQLAAIDIATQGLTLLLLFITVVFTASATRSSQQSVTVAKDALQQIREVQVAENAPYVLVYFDNEPHSQHIHLIIKNVGKTPARDVKLIFTPPLQSLYQKQLDKNSALQHGIPSLAPQQQIVTYIGEFHRYLEAKKPETYTVQVTYRGQQDPEDSQTLDLSMYKAQVYLGKKGIPELVNQAETIAKHLQTLTQRISHADDQTDVACALRNPPMEE